MRPLFLVMLLLSLPLPAGAQDRVPLEKSFEGKEISSEVKVKFPGRRGYTYEILDSDDTSAFVRVFDTYGLEIQGTFEVPVGLVQEPLKAEIVSGLEAAADGVPSTVKGCCEVKGGEKESSPPRAPVERKPALAPGSIPVPEMETVAIPAPAPVRAAPRIVQPPPSLPKPAPLRPSPRSAAIVAKSTRSPKPRPEPPPAVSRPSGSHPSLCRAFRRFREQGVPEKPLRQALYFFSRSGSKARYLSLADYSQRSSRKRFYLLDLEELGVTREKVSHGAGMKNNGWAGDPDHDGMLNRCGGSNSNMTRAGFFRVDDYYFSSKGHLRWPLLIRDPARNGMRLTGLTPGVNNYPADGVVFHEATYNREGAAIMGRSSGCPAFIPGRGKPLMDKLRSGSLFYSYAPVCHDQMKKVLKQVEGWERFCAG